MSQMTHSLEFNREPFKNASQFMNEKPQKRSINSIKNHRTARESFFPFTHCFNYEQIWMKSLTGCGLFVIVFRDLLSNRTKNIAGDNKTGEVWLSLNETAIACSLCWMNEWMNEWMKSSMFAQFTPMTSQPARFKLTTTIMVLFDLSPPSLALY